MFQDAIGRVGSRILAPPKSFPLFVYIDAGGRSEVTRVWGGLVAVGEAEDAWLLEALRDLRVRNVPTNPPTEELKGAVLPSAEIRRVARRLREEDHRVLFWANWYPEASSPEITRISKRAIAEIRSIRADRLRLDAPAIQSRYNGMADYLDGLKSVNRYKVMSVLAHLQWLMAELERVHLGPQVGSVRVLVDQEGLPEPAQAADLVKLHVAASLQAVGMSVRLTGKALREGHDKGAVVVDMNADSRDFPGLQLTDMLLQLVQRKLPGYGGSRRLSDAEHLKAKRRPALVRLDAPQT